MSDFDQARKQMLDCQIRTADVTDRRVQAAFGQIPRHVFVPRSKDASAYADAEVETGPGRTMMRPRDIAKLIQAADIEPTELVLDIACGRGYSTAILASLADTVVALEEDAATIEKASTLLSEVGADNAAVIEGELKAGIAGQGPFDVIFVNGAVEDIPQAWLDQLADGGRLVAIVREGAVGRAVIVSRAGERIGERTLFNASARVLPGFERERAFSL